MFVVLIVAVVVLATIAALLYATSHNMQRGSATHLSEFDKINQIEDPTLRQIAINDWLNKRV